MKKLQFKQKIWNKSQSPVFTFVLSIFCLFLTAQPSLAERRYSLSGQLDLSGGATNSLRGAQSSGSFLSDNLDNYFSIAPSLDLETSGRRFDLGLGYGFSYNYYDQDQTLITRSHYVDGQLSSNLSENVRLTVTNRFNTTPDYISYELARNLVVFSDGFGYAYTPVPSKQFFKTNDARARVDWNLGPRSFLSFIVGGNYRDYEENTDPNTILNDQYRLEGSLAFNRRQSSRTSWSLRYEAVKNIYRSYGSALTHNAMAGFSHQLRPSVLFTFEAGPSYVTTSRSDKNYWGFAGNARLTKTMEITQVSLFALHRAGDSSGVGYITDTTRGGAGFTFRPLRKLNISFSTSAYRTKQRSDFALKLWGVDGGAQVSLIINRFLRLGAGANYRRIEGHVSLDREYKQFYGSINLIAPEFWNITR
jgi:hypothetical protein